MGTLYERIKYLCDTNGIKPGKMCVDAGISKGLISDLKYGRKKSIMIETAQKMANYFKVPVGVITGEGDKKAFSENMAHYMTSFDTPESLASKIGVAEESVIAWLAGDEYPDIDDIDKLANLFGVLREDLIKPRPPEQEEYYHSEWMDTNTFDAMCKFKCLSPMQQRVIIRQMETFIVGKASSFPDMEK